MRTWALVFSFDHSCVQEGEGGRMMDWVSESSNQHLVRPPLQLCVLRIDADGRKDEMKKKLK